MSKLYGIVALALLMSVAVHAFTLPLAQHSARFALRNRRGRAPALLRMSTEPSEDTAAPATSSPADPMEEEEMDAEQRLQLEKIRRAQELREQEVFMKKSTGKYLCSNCDWEYDEVKGDSMMIGGMIKPGTSFAELPSNWRCPVCRASKDSFQEQVEEIPGFEVNQGYGLGGNSLTSGQKSGLIFGGLGLFFLLFLSGYALS